MRSHSMGGRVTAAVACAVLALNLVFGLTAVSKRTTLLRLAPGGTVSDLYARWLGTRRLLVDGLNPYTEEAAREGERGFYGRALTAREKALDTENYLGFNYPLHVAVLLAPLALLPFPLVQVLALVGLAVLLAWTAAGWCAAVGWPAGRRSRLLVCAAALTSLPALDLLTLQQLSGLVLGLVAIATIQLTASSRRVVAGICLACATIKPQLAALPVTIAIAWALARPRQRRSLLAGFGATLVMLVGISLLLLPSWPAWFISNARAYAAQVPASSVARLPVPARIIVDVLVVVVTLAMLWRRGALREDAEPQLLHVVALSLAAALVLAPADHLYDRVMLVPALISLGRLRGGEMRSAPGLATALVTITLGVVLASGAVLGGLLIYTGGAQVGRPLVGLVLFGYVALPVETWLALALRLRASARGLDGRLSKHA